MKDVVNQRAFHGFALVCDYVRCHSMKSWAMAELPPWLYDMLWCGKDKLNSERLVVSFMLLKSTPSDAHNYSIKIANPTRYLFTFSKRRNKMINAKCKGNQDSRYHVMSYPSKSSRLTTPRSSAVRLCLTVVVHVVVAMCLTRVVRGLWLLRRVGRGLLLAVARVGRVLGVGLQAGGGGRVVGLQCALARLVEDDAGVDEKAKEGGARKEEHMLVYVHNLLVARRVYSQDDDWNDNVRR